MWINFRCYAPTPLKSVRIFLFCNLMEEVLQMANLWVRSEHFVFFFGFDFCFRSESSSISSPTRRIYSAVDVRLGWRYSICSFCHVHLRILWSTDVHPPISGAIKSSLEYYLIISELQ